MYKRQILNGINSWSKGLLIFVMALIGMSSFECFAQNWCITRNKWYEIPFFLATAFVLFHPGAIAGFFGIHSDKKYFFYILGLLIYALAVFMQKIRLRAGEEAGNLTPA